MRGIHFHGFLRRLVSAVVLAAAALTIILLGDVPVLIAVVISGCWALYEWISLARRGRRPVTLSLLGGAYIGLSFFIFYRIGVDYPPYALILFFLMVWSSDIGAYFAGKIWGSARMAAQISPNKTWAGLLGALAGPFVPGMLSLLGQVVTADLIIIMALACLSIGYVEQVGDLLISWLKRHVRVKDTGGLIPGHGGLLDRIDGLMLAAPVFLAWVVYYPEIFAR